MKTVNKLTRVKVESDEHSIHIDCPHCENWEQLGIDDPRKRLNAMPIIKWYPDELDTNEVSVHECLLCKSKFEVEWDYNNSMT